MIFTIFKVLIITRFNALWNSKKAIAISIFQVLLTLGAILGAHYFAAFFDVSNVEFQHNGIKLISISILIFMLLGEYFPEIRHKTDLIPRLAPVSREKRWLFELFYHFTDPLFGLALSFPAAMAFWSSIYSWKHFLSECFLLSIAVVFNYSLKTVMQRKADNFITLILGLLLMLSMAVGMNYYSENVRHSLGANMCLLAVICLLSLQIEVAVSGFKKTFTHIGPDALLSEYPIFLLMFNHGLSRNALISTYLIKGVVFSSLIVLSTYFNDNIWIVIMAWLFISPLPLFIYSFNNLWGFLPNLWLSLEKTSGNVWLLLTNYFFALTIPVSIDFLLGLLLVVFLSNEYLSFFFEFYLSAVLFGILMGFWSSLSNARRVYRTFTMMGNAAIGYELAFIVMIFILTLPLISSWFYLVQVGIGALLIVQLVALPEYYQKRKFHIYQALFKKD